LTPELITAAKKLASRIYRPGHHYKRAGVLLTNLQQESMSQEYLFNETYHNSRGQRLMKIVDGYNRTANHGKIFMAAEGVDQLWDIHPAHMSRRFTTRWDEILEIKI
jgi:DNA polymerase V